MKKLFLEILHEEKIREMNLRDVMGGATPNEGDGRDCFIYFCGSDTPPCPGNVYE